MALKCDCGGEIRKTIDNKDECIICGNTIKGDDKMAKEHDFKIEKVSGTAKIADIWRAIPNYEDFAEAAGYPGECRGMQGLSNRINVRILAKGRHEISKYGYVYVIETDSGSKHIITQRGLTDIQLDEPAQIPEQTYVEIAETFGKQFRDAIRKSYSEGYADGFKQAKFDVEMDEKMYESPQRERDRIVEQAKADVENRFIEGYDGVGKVVDTMFGHCTVEFVVNKEKRTVVALLLGAYAKAIFAKGIAKCAPNDCFNTHIGKAVALRKALEKDIVDYMDVPNPTEVRVGNIVTWEYPNRTYEIEPGMRVISLQDGRDYTEYANIKKAKIIDDSREVSE